MLLNNIRDIFFANIKINNEKNNPMIIDVNNDLINNSLLFFIFLSWNNLDKFGSNNDDILLIKKLGKNNIGLTYDCNIP